LAWYQRTYFIVVNILVNKLRIISFKLFLDILVLNVILILLIYTQDFAQCFNLYRNPFLQSHIIGTTPVHFYKDIDYFNALKLIKRIKQNSFSNLNYNIYQPTQFSINNLPHYHPFRHYHLNILEFSNILPHTHVNILFSSQNFNNCHLLTPDINLLLNKDKPQFIASNFYFYNIFDIEKYLELSQKGSEYVNDFKNNINGHVLSVSDKYKV